MPIYRSIDASKENERRIAEGLLNLKEAFEKVGLPERNLSDTLLLATWNIREFDSSKYGVRGREPLFYIAEIVDRFDPVAVQEVRDDLTALNKLMDYLGGWWKYILTDVTEGTQGNRERMAFLYDSRKIRFGGLAGEIVVPATKRLEPAKQLARTPFLVGVQAGWFKFTICTTHILYGKAKAEDPNRLEEIRVLAEFLADRARERHAWSKNMILLGDFNIFDTSDQTLKAITGVGFVVPKQLQNLPSNAHKPSTTIRSPLSLLRCRTSWNSAERVFSTSTITSTARRTRSSTWRRWARLTSSLEKGNSATRSHEVPTTTPGVPSRCRTTCQCGSS
jgi:endonuclease/exonuclease/phosphatase family metal-dependent hydrolase